jgi:hypothetical protein
LLVLAIPAVPAAADPTAGPPICSSAGSALSGNYDTLTIHGNAYVPSGATLSVSGNLTLAPGSCLDAFTVATVTVGRNVIVRSGATLGLGCSPGAIGPEPPCGNETTDDTVGGNIVANGANTMYLTAVTVHGNIISNGGGPGPVLDPYVNFPIKENTVFGNIIVRGWEGAWFGILRNNVHGNVIAVNNVGVTTGEGTELDSTEIVTNTIGGNLICFGNTPPAQIGDSGGTPNVVAGNKIGECSSL